MLRSHSSVFGLDVGFQTIKLAQLARRLGGFEVSGKIEVPVPVDAVTKNGINHGDEIARLIQSALPKATPRPIVGRLVYAALPESLTFTKTVVLPLTKPKEIANAIAIQSAEYLPVSPEEVYLDFAVTKRDATSSEILIVALPRILVDSFLVILEKTGLDAVALQSKQIALSKYLVSPSSRDHVLIVDVGKKVSKISLVEYGDLITVSTVALGADDIQQGQPVTALVDALGKIPQFRANQTRRPVRIGQVNVTGTGALLPGLTQALQRELKLPVAIAQPTVSIEGFDHKFAVAIGLALGELR